MPMSPLAEANARGGTESHGSVRVSVVANEMWPLVKDEKRLGGVPLFASRGGLVACIYAGFRARHIQGTQAGGANSMIHVDRESVLSFLVRYAESAKEARMVHMGGNMHAKPKGNGKRSKGKSDADAVVDELLDLDASEEDERHEYIIANGGEAGNNGGRYLSARDAAWHLVRELGFKFYRITEEGLVEEK